ncbi:tetratricopeptide repeat-containing response regulator [Marinomonas pollencensis]|uniref:CheY-like chemotaxis protein n=1 Tax=Marinomonas pollencensis TaxID=491954 RepID=A0A3E0DQX0_9GAMM|nr:tetratricopeptide repeat-containing response regulator [Marinomonas pollencensis]REG85480.1 CheY-like chemotaxis protein [Marinomonas pollencensis]
MVDINTRIRSGPTKSSHSYAEYSALVADEFENSRQSIRQMLVALGFSLVDQTSTGKGVVEACYARKYDLVLCDFRLGHGKNGQQVLEELRQLKLLKSDAIFIVVSAETSRDVVFGIMESHPDDYLSKPFTQGVLSKRLERLFAQNNALVDMKEAQAKQDFSRLQGLCEHHIASQGRYSVWCKKALVDTFLATQSWSELTRLCEQELQERDIEWAMLGMAKMHLLQEEWDLAIQSLESILKSFPQSVESYDLLASCLQKKGRYHKAQQVLEEGIKLSPLVASRQQNMVNLSRENGDIQSAVKAGQQALKLTMNTINESPEEYFQVVDLLADAAVDLEGRDRKKMTDDALLALSKVSKKYSDLHEVRVKKALSESRLYSAQGHNKHAQASLSTAQALLKESPELKTPDIVIELGKTLFLAGQKGEAIQLWQSDNLLSDMSAEQEQAIFDFIDEPIPMGARARAKSLNSQGLNFYAKKDYDEAIRVFEAALEISPNQPGLNLNLAQTAIKKMATSPNKRAMLAKCQEAFARISHVKENHKQFSRLQALKNYVAKYHQDSV